MHKIEKQAVKTSIIMITILIVSGCSYFINYNNNTNGYHINDDHGISDYTIKEYKEFIVGIWGQNRDYGEFHVHALVKNLCNDTLVLSLNNANIWPMDPRSKLEVWTKCDTSCNQIILLPKKTIKYTLVTMTVGFKEKIWIDSVYANIGHIMNLQSGEVYSLDTLRFVKTAVKW